MAIDQATRERILRDWDEWSVSLPDIPREEILAVLKEDNPRILVEPDTIVHELIERWQAGEPSRRDSDSASTRTASSSGSDRG